jgi:hypothetical protein
MGIDSVTPYNGPLVVDVTALKDDIVDLPPRAMVGLKREKLHFNAALNELVQAKAGALDKIGIANTSVDRIEARTSKLAAIRTQRDIAAKLVEVLDETEAYLEDAREGDIAVVAKAIQASGKHIDAGVLASFEATLSYYSQNAEKAVATRRRNAKAKDQDDDPAPTGGGTEP